MRIFEYVPCVRYYSLPSNEDDKQQPATSSYSTQRRSVRKSESAWRPSLGAISEDGAISVTTTKAAAKTATEKSARRTKKAPVTAKKKALSAHGGGWERIDRDEFRHFGVPAFAPTSFLF